MMTDLKETILNALVVLAGFYAFYQLFSAIRHFWG